MSEEKNIDVSRRRFLKGVALSAGAAAVVGEKLLASTAKTTPIPPSPLGPAATAIALNVNGKEYSLEVEPRVTLLNALRDHVDSKTHGFLDLTGTKKVCDRGSCGACTVMVDGKTALSCSMLAIEAQGKKIVTVEGLAQNGKPHPLQEAFVECDGLMCGFCTPGFVMSSKRLLDQNPNPSREEIRHGLSGNICRCGTYCRIFEAVELAASRGKRGG